MHLPILSYTYKIMNIVPESLIQQFFKDGCVMRGFFLRGRIIHGELIEEKLFCDAMKRFSPEDHFAIVTTVLERAMLNPDSATSKRAAQLLDAVGTLQYNYRAAYVECTTKGSHSLLRAAYLIKLDAAYKLPAYK